MRAAEAGEEGQTTGVGGGDGGGGVASESSGSGVRLEGAMEEDERASVAEEGEEEDERAPAAEDGEEDEQMSPGVESTAAKFKRRSIDTADYET